MRDLSLLLSVLSFLLVFFELNLTFHGGWDDLNFKVIFVTPLVAAVALIAAVVNVAKFRAKSRIIIPALSMVAISALFFCYVMITTSVTMLARS